LAYFNDLRRADRKVLRLFSYAHRVHFVCFRGVNQVEAENVLLRTCANVKTISIVGWIADKAAILEDSPIVACAKTDKRWPNDSKSDQRGCAA
jgi:hypothetical protein